MSNRPATHCVSFVLTFAACAHAVLAGDAAEDAFESRLRRPVALQLSVDGQWLYVANRRNGSLSVVDVSQRAAVKEIDLGQQISSLTCVADTSRWLATDEAAHELLLLEADGQSIAVKERLAVAQYPVDVTVSRDGRRCYVSSLWSRRLTIIDLSAEADDVAHVARVVDLPFAPRRLLLVEDDSRLIVGDSFGGRLGVVDCRSGELLSVREFPGHNIRGLGVSADGRMLIVSHQMLNELAHTVRNDVHWGLLMSNDLRWLRLESVLDDKADLYKGAHMHPLGEAGRATGDPEGLAVTSDGTVVVALGGVDEIALGKEDDFSLYRLKVGKRPTAVTVSADGRMAYVANTFGDSISVVDLGKRETVGEISLGPQSELTSIDQGELLFYDARFSHDRWMSCNSCHTDGHTNGLLNDNFSDESFGAPKRVLSLLGRADTAPFAWNASAKDYDEQIRKSITVTMQSDAEPTDKEVESLTAYLESLSPPPPIDVMRGERDEAAVTRGGELFDSMRCNTCHRPPAYTSPGTYDVGLKDKQGNERFNPPPLRGVGQRGPYFHDGRATSLEDVFREYKHKLPRELTDAELRDLLAFLRSL